MLERIYPSPWCIAKFSDNRSTRTFCPKNIAHTNDIAHRIAEYLEDDLAGFRYTRSRTQFRCIDKPLVDDIFIDVTYRTGGSYTIAFYVGVQHTDVESAIADLENRKITPYDRTIFQYSPNVNKQNVIPFADTCWWYGLPRDIPLSRIGPEIRHFFTSFVFPYHARFHDLLAIRESLELRDGLSLNHTPFKQVLAIDALLSDWEHVSQYLTRLQNEADGGYHHRHEIFNEFYPRLAERFTEMPDFQLVPKPSRTKP